LRQGWNKNLWNSKTFVDASGITKGRFPFRKHKTHMVTIFLNVFIDRLVIFFLWLIDHSCWFGNKMIPDTTVNHLLMLINPKSIRQNLGDQSGFDPSRWYSQLFSAHASLISNIESKVPVTSYFVINKLSRCESDMLGDACGSTVFNSALLQPKIIVTNDCKLQSELFSSPLGLICKFRFIVAYHIPKHWIWDGSMVNPVPYSPGAGTVGTYALLFANDRDGSKGPLVGDATRLTK
jgi:hypothetical protein